MPIRSDGKSWLVADIHGAFSALWDTLVEAGFQPEKDILYSLGDLVNRGPQSKAAQEWLKKPWFKPVRGNHEAMVISAHAKPFDSDVREQMSSVGGDWWYELGSSEQEHLVNGFLSLPLIRTVKVKGVSVGLVHADVPEGESWLRFQERVCAGESAACHAALWSRSRWQSSIGSGLTGSDLPMVDGVDWVFVGHSPVSKPTVVGNVVFADCGLWRGNTRGILCLDDWVG